jgi:hypothetical protein
MFESVRIHAESEKPLVEFLQDNDFFVEEVTDRVLKANRSGELPVFLNADESSIYFEVDLGDVSTVASQDLYHKLLDLNTEILPVSIGINSTNPKDPRLVLIESRETVNLDENEILAVFDAMELAVDKVEALLSKHMK